ncbi:MAG TPA: glycosyltransferase family 39 protein [Candidatus Methylomirabilis sp.]|nr:glycosyltransferase family 39 protein [Candidatus Methylomirabilis sp.]
MTPKSSTCRAVHPAYLALLGLAALTVFRLWYSTRLDLVPDEAYFWLWSKHLAASYRDKGPGVAWTIALGTRLFGDTVFGIRALAVLLSAGTGWLLFVLARRLYDGRTALWCLAVAAVMPLFAVGSILMIPDALSVFFWAWAINVLWAALENGKTRHWIALGVIIGCGFLSKFTNGVQLVCIAWLLYWSRSHRRFLLSRQSLVMVAAFVVTILPIIYWNVEVGWIHAGALHSRSGVEDSFGVHPVELFRFLGEQAGVVSPLLMVGMVVALVGMWWSRSHELRVRLLVSQCVPVQALFIFFSLNKAGKSNWVAPALITGIILLVVFWRELVAQRTRWRWAVGAAFVLAFLMTAFLHDTAILNLSPNFDPLVRAEGWTDFGAHVQRARVLHRANLLIGNHYSQASMMQFYLPDRPPTYLPPEPYGKTQFTLWPGYRVTAETRALFVTDSLKPPPQSLVEQFSECSLVDDFWSLYGGRPRKRFRIYLLERTDTRAGARDCSAHPISVHG